MNYRKIIPPFVYYFLPLVLFSLSIFADIKGLLIIYGNIALYMLTITLYISPLSALTNIKLFKKLMTWRRELGLTTFWIYLAHGVGQTLRYGFTADNFAPSIKNNLFFGALAGFGLLLMALTSNDYAVRKLKRNWKRLHRIVYAVYFLALYHASLGAGNFNKFYLLGGTYFLLKLAQYRKTGRI
jgi:sulfoxide reductase heme-binding subunit YedZ